MSVREPKLSNEAEREEIVELTARLLMAISHGDWETYTQLCDPSLTCFEPEACGHLVDGLDFHKFYFDLPGSDEAVQSTIVTPHVRVVGDMALIAYVRLTQKTVNGSPISTAVQETRVWQKLGGRWKHIHFHRSPQA